MSFHANKSEPIIGNIMSKSPFEDTETWFWEPIDQRTKNFPLVQDNGWAMLSIMIPWLLFVTKIGPWLMSNREPFKLRRTMLLYNTLMVIMNSYAFYEIIAIIKYGGVFIEWEFPSRDDFSADTLRTISLGWWYWMTKFFDLADTVFFVLRKKQSQVTTLHLYHHFMVPTLGWVAIKLAPMAPPLMAFALLNSVVHVVMYSYYCLAAFGPKIQKYLWWKKYITQMQLIQFGILITYGMVMAFKAVGYPRIWFWIAFAQNPLFFVMFWDFYRNSYKKTTKKID